MKKEQSEYNKLRHPEVKMRRDLRLRYVADLVVKGYCKRKIIDDLKKEWGISYHLADGLYREALVTLTDEEGLEKLREVNTARLLDLYNKAVESGDLKSQLKAIDLLNRTNSIYRTTINLGEDTEFVFNFGQN